jgi:Ca2+-binding EF-hand superfamily protein
MDNTGYITEDNLIDAFSKFNKELTKTEIQEIMNAHDFSKEGSIS